MKFVEKRILDYDIIVSGNLGNLIGLVQDSIKCGWEPIGGVASDPIGFYQAMVKMESDLVGKVRILNSD